MTTITGKKMEFENFKVGNAQPPEYSQNFELSSFYTVLWMAQISCAKLSVECLIKGWFLLTFLLTAWHREFEPS